MIFIKGVPGSGKSHYMVKHLLDNKKSIKTNIPMEYYPKRVQALDNDTFKDDLKRIYQDCLKLDNIVQHKLYFKKNGYYNVDYYLDEVHVLGFDKATPEGRFFASVSRHTGCNIFFATQVTEFIDKVYVKMCDQWITCVPPTQRKHAKTFEYLHHQSSAMNDLKVYKTERIKGDPKIFWWYDSGNADFGDESLRNILKKFQLFFVFLLLAIVYAIYHFVSSDALSVKSPTDNATSSLNKTVVTVPEVVEDVNKTVAPPKRIDTLLCDTDNGCYYNQVRYGFDEFVLQVLPNLSRYKRVLVAETSSGYKMYRFNFYD